MVWLRPPLNREERRAVLRKRAAQRAQERREHLTHVSGEGAVETIPTHVMTEGQLEAELAQFADEMAAWAEEGLADTAALWSDL